MYDVDGNGWIDLIEMTKIVKGGKQGGINSYTTTTFHIVSAILKIFFRFLKITAYCHVLVHIQYDGSQPVGAR